MDSRGDPGVFPFSLTIGIQLKYPKHIEYAIDMESPYAKKYLELVSKPSTCKFTEDHHIVPVAYFVDVMGISDVRRPGSLDMAKENIVTLSKGRHLLAHYYLVRCAQKCIRSQMVNAFRRMYNDRDKWDDKEVLKKSKEIDRFYRSLKGKKIPHKDGTEEVSRDNLVSTRQWKDGANVGLELKRRPNGKFVEITDHDAGIRIETMNGEVNVFKVTLFGPMADPAWKGLMFSIEGPGDGSGLHVSVCEDKKEFSRKSSSGLGCGGAMFWISYFPQFNTDFKVSCRKGGSVKELKPEQLVGSEAFHRLVRSCATITEKFLPLMDFNGNTEKCILHMQHPEVQGAISRTPEAEPIELDWLLEKVNQADPS